MDGWIKDAIIINQRAQSGPDQFSKARLLKHVALPPENLPTHAPVAPSIKLGSCGSSEISRWDTNDLRPHQKQLSKIDGWIKDVIIIWEHNWGPMTPIYQNAKAHPLKP